MSSIGRAEAERAIRVGYIEDFISGHEVRATAEEVDAVQVFSKRLVEDFGYPKDHIQTRPQFRVRSRPSDEARTYPVDIAVFKTNKKDELASYILVECKRKNRKDGLEQLKIYMDMSPAEIGVWFNGDDHIYLRKVLSSGGSRAYVELPNIPRYGQRIDDVGLFTRSDLRAPSNLKAVFRDIRNHLAGMTTGITRDEALAAEIINLLFCKILDEQETSPSDIVQFRAGVSETADEVKARIETLFEQVKLKAYGDVFRQTDALNLDAESVRYIVGELQNYCITEADRDAVGDAFEVFIGPALRGAEGQFFTPRNVVKMVIDILAPLPGEKIIDPACGSGGFLITALEYTWAKLREEGQRKGWSERQLTQREIQVATDCFRGIDKDGFLSKVCKAYMALIGDGRGGIFCENSLARMQDWSSAAQAKVKAGSFDVVVTNPPFGAKIAVKGSLLAQYELGHKWKRDKASGRYELTTDLENQRSPQILFLERCFELLRNGGRMGIVLPESILGNPSYQYLMQFIRNKGEIRGIVTMPEALFKTSGKGGTHTKVAVLIIVKGTSSKRRPIFMSDVKWCGHDSRGNPTLRKDPLTGLVTLLDEVPLVPAKYDGLTSGRLSSRDHLGYMLDQSQAHADILVPKYHDPEIEAQLHDLSPTHDLISIESLVGKKIVSIATGVEPGKMAYGTGEIPFIRTSDLSNWEIKADFKHGVSEQIYAEFQSKSDVRADDILLVRDGTYLIGTSAMVTAMDLPMLYQSHLLRVRVEAREELDPWLFFAALNAPVVKRQIRSKQFTQDIIDTIGRRFSEVIIAVPKAKDDQERIAAEVKEIVTSRATMRQRAKEVALEVQGISTPKLEDLVELEDI